MKVHALLVAGVATLSMHVAVGDSAAPSHHQLMKECMAKQKEAESGRNHDDMKAFCADWVKTQRDAAKNGDSKG